MKKSFLLATCLSVMGIHHANAQVVWLKSTTPEPSAPISAPPTNVGVISNIPSKVSAPIYTPAQAPAAGSYDPDKAYMGGGAVVTTPVTTSPSPAITAVAPVQAPSDVIQENSAPGAAFGNNLPFEIAAGMIAPTSFHVMFDSAAHKDALVSWNASSGGDWQTILNKVAHDSGNGITVAGNTIFVSPVPGSLPTGAVNIPAPSQVSTNAIPPAEYVRPKPKGKATVVEPSNSRRVDDDDTLVVAPSGGLAPATRADIARDMPQTSYAPASGGVGVYYAARHQDLQTVLQTWANANGWSVEYDAQVHYTLEQPVTLNGDFTECARTLIHSIRATPKPRDKFYVGNHVLRIFNYDDAS